MQLTANLNVRRKTERLMVFLLQEDFTVRNMFENKSFRSDPYFWEEKEHLIVRGFPSNARSSWYDWMRVKKLGWRVIKASDRDDRIFIFSLMNVEVIWKVNQFSGLYSSATSISLSCSSHCRTHSNRLITLQRLIIRTPDIRTSDWLTLHKMSKSGLGPKSRLFVL